MGRLGGVHRSSSVGEVSLGTWCVEVLGSPPVRELFRSGHLSTVVGLLLGDGRQVAVKIRAAAARLEACAATQRHLHDRGFPCPRLWSDPLPFGDGLVATAEELVPGDQQLPISGRDPGLFASPLARLVTSAPRLESLSSSEPPLPWTGWNHREGGLWPWPDDKDIDLNAVAEPAWIDDAGRRARARLEQATGERLVGHGDWYAGTCAGVGIGFSWCTTGTA